MQQNKYVLFILADENELCTIIVTIYRQSLKGFSLLQSIYILLLFLAGNNNRYQFANPQYAQKAASLLGTTLEELSRVIFGLSSGGMCTPNTPRAPFRTPSPTDKGLDREAIGLEAVEGFIIGLYNEVFSCVASLINRYLN